MIQINPRIGLQQRILPAYRVPFFDALASACSRGLCVFAGHPRPEEAVGEMGRLSKAIFVEANNNHIMRGSLYLCWQSGFIRWLQDWQPDVLIAEANPRYLATPAAVNWMHKRGRPVIAWGLGAPLKQGRLAEIRLGWQRKFFNQFDAIIAYSYKGAEDYHALGIPNNKIFVASNAVTARPTHALPPRSVEYSGGKPVVLFVGRLQVRKRVDILLRACAALPEEDQPQVWVVGDGPARSDLEILSRQILPSARFFGARQGQELEDLFRTADLFVLPGTGGLAVQQAMSFGLPVIVAEADGTQKDLVRSENGWLVPPGDQDTLTRVLKLALKNSLQLRRMGEASYKIVVEDVNLENMVEAFSRAVGAVLE